MKIKNWPPLVRDSRKLRNTYFIQVLITIGVGLAFIVIPDSSSRVALVTSWILGLGGTQTGYGLANAHQKHAPNYTAPTLPPAAGPPPPDQILAAPILETARNHNILLHREPSQGDYTQGTLDVIPGLLCDTLEDEYRLKKIPGETRIPAGEYILDWNNRETDFTTRYRKIFPGDFFYHLELKNVPGFSGIYIHPGNSDDDTSGCILVGKKGGPGRLLQSRATFLIFYRWAKTILDAGDQITIIIQDHEKSN